MVSDSLYRSLIKPALFKMDPELAHVLVHAMLGQFGGLAAALPYCYPHDDLQVTIAGRKLSNPVGLAAGFDKNGTLVDVLGYLGFGWAEVGSITGRASKGNPKPRLFRLPDDEAVINRLGLNGHGAERVAARLYKAIPSLPIAINIAKTNDPTLTGDKAVEDITTSFRAVRYLDAVYVALNTSCPNTAEGCLAETEQLEAMLQAIHADNVRKLPIFLKLSPESPMQFLEGAVELSRKYEISGFICCNTSTSRSDLKTPKEELEKIGHGGLSGKPLRPLALNLCRNVFRLKKPEQQIIAVGGIMSGADAFEFLQAGANAFEVYTGLVYRGPALARMICEELSVILTREGLSIDQVTGQKALC